MRLNPAQQTISDSEARFRVAVAGRRFGKTYLSINEMAKVARYPDKRVFYIAPTYRMCRQILWDLLKEKLTEVNWIKKCNETDLSITLKNGSKISLRGADNPDSLRGVSLDFAIFDEFAFIDEKAWTEVIRPTLSDRKGSAMFITTPNGTMNWAFDLYQRGLDPTEHAWESFQYTTLQGGNVSPEEIEQAKRDLDERTFRQEYEATFEEYANRIFYNFERSKNIKSFDKETPSVVYLGMDFNIDPMSAVVFAREGDSLHAINEIEMYSSNTQEMVDEIQSRYPKSRIWVYPDPACRQRKTSAGGATDLSILQNAGFTVKCPNAHNAIRDGINAVNSRLRSATGEVNLYVDPKCKKVIECLEKHSYKEGTTQPNKESGFDHMADAIRYAVDYMFPIRRETEPFVPQRWGHRI